jgi:hypothetical protein
VGEGEIGHVLVGPGGVYAIESTWTPDDCELDQRTVDRTTYVLASQGRRKSDQRRRKTDRQFVYSSWPAPGSIAVHQLQNLGVGPP